MSDPTGRVEGEPLAGGFLTEVHRVGATVRRVPPERAEFVHALLGHLERAAWSGAPRYLGVDDRGREILSYVEGHVPWAPGEAERLSAPTTLAAVGALVRELHDLTAGTALAGDREVVCHNDLSPRNTVYRGRGAQARPVAFLDWDLAAPGERVDDVAHACWQYAGLGQGRQDPRAAARGVRAVAAGYGYAGGGSRLVERILRWQEDCWRGIEAGIATGHPRWDRLRDARAPASVRAQQQWTRAQQRLLVRALDAPSARRRGSSPSE